MEILMINQQRLIITGLAQRDIGLTNVLSAIAEELKHSWDVLVFAHGLESNGYSKFDGIKTVISIAQDSEATTQIHFETVIKDFKPDTILIIGSPWKSPEFTAVAAKYKLAKLAVYMPIEGRPVDKCIVDSLAGMDLCITYTEFAKNALKNLFGGNNPKLTSIGHGLDSFYKPLTLNYFPADLTFREELRKQLFPDFPDFWKRPMLLNSNRCYYRKRLDLTIKGFALALKEVEASLYLNVAMLTNYEQHKLEKLIRKLGIENNVMLNTLNFGQKTISKTQLLQLYNACDIGITSSMGEGWGLCVFEHAATGAAQIVPDHSSFSENWPYKTALKFEAETPVYLENEAAEMYESKPENISHAIKKLVANPMLMTLYGESAFDHANNKKYKWSAIGVKFNNSLKSLLKKVVIS